MLSQKVFPDTQSYNQMLRRHDTQTANNTLKDRIAEMPTCQYDDSSEVALPSSKAFQAGRTHF